MASSPHDALELFFDSSSDLIAILDWEGRLLLLNPAWNRIFGYRVEDCSGAGSSTSCTPMTASHHERADGLPRSSPQRSETEGARGRDTRRGRLPRTRVARAGGPLTRAEATDPC